jgi:hypothetical protein
MEDTNRCKYCVQVDHLVLEATVDVGDGPDVSLVRPMRCRVNIHLDDGQGLATDLSRGQLVAVLKFFDAIWSQIGGLGGMAPAHWRDVR